MRFLDAGRARTLAEAAGDHHRRLAVAARAPGLGFWAGLVRDELVGWWGLEPAGSAAPDRRAELGYRPLRRHWRQGLAARGR